MAEFKIVYGNATNPSGSGQKYIIHICNNVGAWGAGFVIALSNKWPKTKTAYKNSFKNSWLHTLGSVQVVVVDKDIVVCNMIAQNNINDSSNGWKGDLVDYKALNTCLDNVFEHATQYREASIHAPRIGSGLGGGNWAKIEDMLIKYVYKYDVDCTVYLLKDEE